MINEIWNWMVRINATVYIKKIWIADLVFHIGSNGLCSVRFESIPLIILVGRRINKWNIVNCYVCVDNQITKQDRTEAIELLSIFYGTLGGGIKHQKYGINKMKKVHYWNLVNMVRIIPNSFGVTFLLCNANLQHYSGLVLKRRQHESIATKIKWWLKMGIKITIYPTIVFVSIWLPVVRIVMIFWATN